MNNLISLTMGDTIDIIAPAGKFEPALLPKIEQVISDWGFVPHIPPELLGEDLLCANTDQRRFMLLKDSLLNTDSKAVWCVRGGYGATRLLPLLQTIPAPSHQKLFIGFSDITALHIFLQQQWGWPTIHGPSAHQVAAALVDDHSIQTMRNILLGKLLVADYSVTALNAAARIHQTLTAPIVGGNLTLVECSVATDWQLNTDNKIIFLEDVNDFPYQVDRSLIHLLQAGIFDQAQAVILGDFSGHNKSNGAEMMDKVLMRFAETLSIPAVRLLGIGHTAFNNPLPLGIPAQLQLSEQANLTIRL